PPSRPLTVRLNRVLPIFFHRGNSSGSQHKENRVDSRAKNVLDDTLTDKIEDRGLVEKINAACLQIETGLPDDMANISRRRLLEVDW
ncbi:MAG: hypothetical protein AAF639_25590, partial [Chloroflexota bacterium]